MQNDCVSDSSTSVTVSRQRESQFVISKCQRSNVVTPRHTTDVEEETTEDSESEDRLLAVSYRAGKLGAAYYTQQTGELFVLEEIVDRPPEYQMFRSFYSQVCPMALLLDGKGSATFTQTVKQLVFDHGNNDETKCKIILLSSKEYAFEACKRRVSLLSLPGEPRNCSEEQRALYLRTLLNYSYTQTLHALGALLRYLDLNWSNLNMDLQSKPQFLSLKNVSLSDIVTMDADTYRGLQIFSAISHPSSFKIGAPGSTKEGLSLCHVLSKCSSQLGQSRMRVLLQHPSTDLVELRKRQEVLAFFSRPQNDSLMKNICSSMRFIRNVNGILAKMKDLQAKSYQWKSLYNTLYNAILICEVCEKTSKSSDFLLELATSDNKKLYEMALYMNRIIDFDLSKSEGKFTVKAGVDPELDKKKQTMSSLQGLMSETAKVELERLPEFVQECSMLYMPHLGYLLGVKAWAEDLSVQQKELPHMKFMFQNNDYIHYKSKGCEELDVIIGDAYPEVVSHETRIMMRLTAVLLENLPSLAALVDKCALLDCLISLAKVSRELNFVRPELTTDKIINIKQGKHPLHIVMGDNFVPNDTDSSEGAGYVKILTGPNASGKSVYMKQVALIVYLAHIGCFVPAESATIGIVKHIFTRIQSTECIAAHMSAFLIDLRQMALALRESSSRSLLLLDEFGKGTAQADGRALLAASLNALLVRGAACPHVWLSSHFSQLPRLLLLSPLLRFQHFAHVLEQGVPVFLFRLSEGAQEGSLALQVAAESGIDRQLARRAEQVMDCLKTNSLPPAIEKITAKLNTPIELIKNDLIDDET